MGCRLYHFVAVLTRRGIEARVQYVLASCTTRRYPQRTMERSLAERTLPYRMCDAPIRKCIAPALQLLLECNSDPQRTPPVWGTADTLCTKDVSPTAKRLPTKPISTAESNLSMYRVRN